MAYKRHINCYSGSLAMITYLTFLDNGATVESPLLRYPRYQRLSSCSTSVQYATECFASAVSNLHCKAESQSDRINHRRRWTPLKTGSVVRESSQIS